MITIKKMTQDQLDRAVELLDWLDSWICNFAAGTSSEKGDRKEVQAMASLLKTGTYTEDGLYVVDAVYTEEMDGKHQPYGWVGSVDSAQEAIMAAMDACTIDNKFIAWTADTTEEQMQVLLANYYRESGFPLQITNVLLDGESVDYDEPEVEDAV